MTIKEKIGQMMMIGLDGDTVNKQTVNMLEDYHVGGFIISSYNVGNSEQLYNLITELKSLNKKNHTIPLFLSIDEEGGRVSRLPNELINFPSNQIIAEKGDKELAYEIGTILAEKVDYFGLNMNFAPVLDINSNPRNPVIGDRSFGSNPEIVSTLGVQTMKGIQDTGIIPVVKHFPGHGDTFIDSHRGLPVITHDMERLETFELVPFKEAIEQNTDVIMTAHILLSEIDKKNPSSLSNKIITKILREQLQFQGVVITDDLTMGAIVANYEIGEAAVKAILAGNDIILVAHHAEKRKAAVEALLSAVEDGTISEDRINDSVYRILELKKKYSLSDEMEKTATIPEINKKAEKIIQNHFK